MKYGGTLLGFFCIGLFVALEGTLAAQNDSRAEISGGYSYSYLSPTPGQEKVLSDDSQFTGSGLHGWKIGGAVPLIRRMAMEFEFSRYSGRVLAYNIRGFSGTRDRIEFNDLSVLAGPSLRAFIAGRLTASVSALFGVNHGSQSADGSCCYYDGGLSGTHFAVAAGGAIDIALTERFAFRLVQPRVYVLRGKLDIGGERATTANFMISTGLVYRFPRR